MDDGKAETQTKPLDWPHTKCNLAQTNKKAGQSTLLEEFRGNKRYGLI